MKCLVCKSPVSICLLVYWEGCEHCGFLQDVYKEFPPYNGFELEYRHYSGLAIKRELDRQETEELIKGVK